MMSKDDSNPVSEIDEAGASTETQQTEAPSPGDELINYQLVIAERWRMFNMMMEARAASNGRLKSYLGAAVGLLIVLALARPSSASVIQQIVGVLAALSGGVAITLAGRCVGGVFKAPGNYDWDSNHTDYIRRDTKQCLLQILADLLDSVSSLEATMQDKADAANLVERVLCVQVLLTVGYWASASVTR